MGWTVFCWIFGVVAIVGPLALIGWYYEAAREQVKRMKAKAGKGAGVEG
ncbi:MAG: hypothetical protein GX537_04040 [Actinobacteria bacterium]|nr:hypothetical protein [Actinomycetota bacterium]